jgi:hypothetical protein
MDEDLDVENRGAKAHDPLMRDLRPNEVLRPGTSNQACRLAYVYGSGLRYRCPRRSTVTCARVRVIIFNSSLPSENLVEAFPQLGKP